MNRPFDQPKPTAGEWTADIVNAALKDHPYAASTLASTHNAALEKAKQDGWYEGRDHERKLIREELAAERERLSGPLLSNAERVAYVEEIQQLREQLAAERRAAEVEINEGVAVRDINNLNKIQELEHQLTGERTSGKAWELVAKGKEGAYVAMEFELEHAREEIQLRSKLINQLREQLSAERKASSLLSIQLMDYHGKLAAAQAAIKSHNVVAYESGRRLPIAYDDTTALDAAIAAGVEWCSVHKPTADEPIKCCPCCEAVHAAAAQQPLATANLRLVDALKRLAMRVLQSDFYLQAKQETDDALLLAKVKEGKV